MTASSATVKGGTRVERPKTKHGVLSDMKEFVTITKTRGGLVPMAMVATILGVSRQRVHQLADEGTFTVFQFYGMKWLLEEEVISFGKLKREAGENQFAPSNKELWKSAHEIGKEFTRRRRGQ